MLKRVPEAPSAPAEDSDLMKITPLGAGQEVGRSCHIIDFKVSPSPSSLSFFKNGVDGPQYLCSKD